MYHPSITGVLARRYQRLEQADVSRRPHGINEFQPADLSIVAEHGGDGGVCLVLGSGKAVRAVLDGIGQDIEITNCAEQPAEPGEIVPGRATAEGDKSGSSVFRSERSRRVATRAWCIASGSIPAGP